MNFAPYQDQSPETERALSPPPQDASRSKSPNLRSPPLSPPPGGRFSPSSLPPPSFFGNDNTSGNGNSSGNARTGGYRADLEDQRPGLGAFETSLPMRLDYEAVLAYVLLPPAGGVFLLLFEHKSDYVRCVRCRLVSVWSDDGAVTDLYLLGFMPGNRACCLLPCL